MDSTLWYLVAFCGLFAVSLALWAMKFLFPRFRNQFVRYFKYPLLVGRGRYWDSVSRLEACGVVLFFSLNLVVIFSPFTTLDWRQVERRAAFASGINLIPLCLGGRMGPVIAAFNIHRSTYLLLHHWIGRIAILDGIIHAVTVLLLRPRPGLLVTSGWAAFSIMLSIVVLSLCLARAFLGRWFLLSHRVLTISGLGVLIWHVLRQSRIGSQFVVGLSASIWIMLAIWRFYRLFVRRLSAEVVDICRGSGLLKIEVVLRKPVKVAAGEYFNIFFPGDVTPFALAHSCSCVAFWHPPDLVQPCQQKSNVSFLISYQNSHAASLAKLAKGQRLLLEGPFGKDLKLENIGNIVLAAHGIGIAGVLPLALELAERKRYDEAIRKEIQTVKSELDKLQRTALNDEIVAEQRAELIQRSISLRKQPQFRDATRKINIFWSLEDNMQMTLVQDQLRSLQKLDPDHKLLVFWCGYPSQRVGDAPFAISDHWMCLEHKAFDMLITSTIRQERKNAPGSMIVTVCGGPKFVDTIRRGVIDSVDGNRIDFAETEFRPRAGI